MAVFGPPPKDAEKDEEDACRDWEKQRFLCTLSDGDAFSPTAFLSRSKHTLTAVCVDDTLVGCLSHADYSRVMRVVVPDAKLDFAWCCGTHHAHKDTLPCAGPYAHILIFVYAFQQP